MKSATGTPYSEDEVYNTVQSWRSAWPDNASDEQRTAAVAFAPTVQPPWDSISMASTATAHSRSHGKWRKPVSVTTLSALFRLSHIQLLQAYRWTGRGGGCKLSVPRQVCKNLRLLFVLVSPFIIFSRPCPSLCLSVFCQWRIYCG